MLSVMHLLDTQRQLAAILEFIMKGNNSMKKERVRINLDISKDLNEKLRKQADKQDMSMNALIRIALEKYLKEVDKYDR